MTLDIAKLRTVVDAAKLNGELRHDPADGSFATYDESGHMETIVDADTRDTWGGLSIAHVDVDAERAALICAAVNALPQLCSEIELLQEVADAAHEVIRSWGADGVLDFGCLVQALAAVDAARKGTR